MSINQNSFSTCCHLLKLNQACSGLLYILGECQPLTCADCTWSMHLVCTRSVKTLCQYFLNMALEHHTHIGNKRNHEQLSWQAGNCSCVAYTQLEQPQQLSLHLYSSLQVYRDIQSWFVVSSFDIGHPCDRQLTCVKTRCLLTNISWPYHGLKFGAHPGHIFF